MSLQQELRAPGGAPSVLRDWGHAPHLPFADRAGETRTLSSRPGHTKLYDRSDRLLMDHPHELPPVNPQSSKIADSCCVFRSIANQVEISCADASQPVRIDASDQ
jgi:hypothetical protein